MKLDQNLRNYVEWNVEGVIKIKKKYGYRVILKYPDGSKKEQQKSGFETHKEALAARDRTIGELAAGTYVVYENVSVKDFFGFWLEEDIHKRVGSHETYSSYEGIIRNHIVPYIGRKKMNELNRGDIQRLYNDRTEYSVSVARNVKVVVNTALKYAVVHRILSENPAEGVCLPKKAGKKKYHERNIDSQKTMTVEQVMTLLEASRKSPIHMQVLFNVLMGLRRSEIIGVKYSDVDYINRTLKVQRQLGRKLGVSKEDVAPKTYTKQEVRLKTPSSYRILPIPDYVFEAILEERKKYEIRRKRKGKEFQDLDYICCSSYGRPRSKDYHWSYYKELLAENNLPDVTWHHLRSTFCTMLLKNDFNPKAVAKLMGHAKEIITVDVYGDKKNIIADCVNELQPFLDEVLPGDDEGTDVSGDEYMINPEEFME